MAPGGIARGVSRAPRARPILFRPGEREACRPRWRFAGGSHRPAGGDRSDMTIGFDRKVRANWLDLTARLAAEGLTPSGVRDRLHEALEGEVSGESPQSAPGQDQDRPASHLGDGAAERGSAPGRSVGDCWQSGHGRSSAAPLGNVSGHLSLLPRCSRDYGEVACAAGVRHPGHGDPAHRGRIGVHGVPFCEPLKGSFAPWSNGVC